MEPVVRLIYILIQLSCGSHYTGFFMPADSTQDIWLAHVERTMDKTSPMIGPWVGCMESSRFCGHGPQSCRPWGRRESKKEIQDWWCWWSFYQSLTYLCTRQPWNCIFPGKVESTQRQPDSVPSFIFCLNWTPFSLCFPAVADYDVHSLLSSRLWLASNQRLTLHYYCPCYSSQTTAEHITAFFSERVARFLLFVI